MTASGAIQRETGETELNENHVGALRILHAARSALITVLIATLAWHVAGFVIVQAAPQGVDPGVEIGDSGEHNAASPASVGAIETWLSPSLAVTEVTGLVAGGMLVLCYVLNVNICLVGRLGSVREGVAAVLAVALVWLVLLPWYRWMAPLAGTAGVYTTITELREAAGPAARGTPAVAPLIRFVVCPVVVMLITLFGDSLYARGYRLVRRRVEALQTG